jgi:tetratricopeptide (TPR) repeat protein
MAASSRCSFLALLALAALATAARAERPPLQSDLDKCALRASERGNRSLSGTVRFDLLRRSDGQVYAVYVHGEQGVDDRALEHCIANSMVQWSFGPPEKIDFTSAYPLSFTQGGAEAGGVSATLGIHSGQTPPEVHMPENNRRAEPMDLNVTAAQGTLELNDGASTAERGIASLTVRRYPEALAQLKEALVRSPGDPQALRGMAVALAESGGDLKEARRLAEQLIAASPRSEGGHEALLRVCLVAKDDLCAFKQWKEATHAEDTAPRGYVLRDFEAPMRAVAARLQATAASGGVAPGSVTAGVTAQGAAQQQVADPCAQEQGDDRQALCIVKRCLDAGSAEYAKELSQQNNVPYVAGEWRAKAVGAGKMLVTRPIGAREKGAAPSHDALWLVKLGDKFVIHPSNTEATQITLTHNACGPRPAP